ncbi:MAG: GNAT family N-acetyltransferase [Phycisphaerae bacterium]
MATQLREQLHLEVFDPRYAATIAQWTETDEQLRWLAPSTHPPLTAEKVIGWKKPTGDAFLLTRKGDAEPVGYGELNPMRREVDHLWLGHVVIRPDQRGRGTGQAFVRALLDHAFDRCCAGRVSLIVFPDNTVAIQCYVRAGFTIIGDEYHRFGGIGPRYRFLRLGAAKKVSG